MPNPSKRFLYFSFILIAGLIVASLSFASPAPVAAQDGGDSGPALIESDSDLVLESGNWQAVEDANASGGSYLVADSSDDVLTVFFEGTSVEILFVRDIDAGSVQIEIDDVVVRTVFSSASFKTYDGSASVDYLEEGVHKLRIYSTDGSVGIDAIRAIPVKPNISEELLAKVQEEPVLVFIDLRAPELGSVASLEQMTDEEISGTIDMLQGAVLDTLNTQATSRGVAVGELFDMTYQYDWSPSLAGYITAEGVLALQSHPAVAGIMEVPRGDSHLDGSRPFINVYEVENEFNLTGRGVTVAVLDSGVDDTHPDLVGDITAQGCVAPSCPGGANDAPDENGHGTHVTGIITSGDDLYRGMAPDADTVQIKISNASGGWSGDTFVAGLDWVRTNRYVYDLDILNISQGTNARYSGNCNTDWNAAYSVVAQLNTQDVAIFASSGNNGETSKMSAPACFSHVIAVGATGNASNTVASYSNNSSMLDMYAPGSSIMSTQNGGGYVSLSGTSMAAPTAAGVAALMLEANPFMDEDTIESIMETTGVSITHDSITRPRVDALATMEYFIEQDYSRQPTYTFEKDGSTQYYDFWVYSSTGSTLWNGWYQVGNGITCGSTTCSVDPDIWVGSALGASNIRWYVRSWTGSSWDGWNGPFVKNISAPLHVAPASTIGDSDGFPIFSWYDLNRGESLYRLYIYKSGSGVVFDEWLSQAEANCSGGVCNYELPHEFDNVIDNGTYTWWLQAWGLDGFGPWSNGATFTQSVSAPGAPAAYYPLDTDTPFPTFDLDVGTGQTWFFFDVYTSTDTYVWSGWATKPEVCGDMDTFALCRDFSIPVALNDGGDYKYRVLSYGLGGTGLWSSWVNFSINIPSPVSVYPLVSVNRGDPSFEWDKDDNALWYELVIDRGATNIYSEWHYGDDVCGADICSVTPDLYLSNSPDDYEVKMRAWGYGGFSPSGYTSTFFTLNYPAPGDPELLNTFELGIDQDITDTVTGYDNIFYVWEDVDYASWYQLQIRKGGSVVYDKWLRRTTIGCVGGNCTQFVGVDELLHTDGNYQWQVRAWGPGGLGNWSAVGSLTISNTQPGQPSLIYPLSTISTYNPVFEWTHEDHATWQYFVLKKGGSTVESAWYHYRAPELSTCVNTSTVCTFQLPYDLTNGSYSWYVYPWGPAGGGSYSATGNFTINVPTPATPTLTYPPTNLIRVDQAAFGYEWSTVSYALWYYFQVYDKDGATIYSRWVHSSDCGGGCEIYADLPNGEYYTWRVRAWNYTDYSGWTPERTIHIFD